MEIADDNEDCADCEVHGREVDPWYAVNIVNMVDSMDVHIEDMVGDKTAAENKCTMDEEVSELVVHSELVGLVLVGTVDYSLGSVESFEEYVD